ncbi:lipopolysaccharide biosynthesis protein [Lysobacter koreensis]|uniref:Lipopolysaccharide biosynthesis protein n=1 Tax=Lysobacter koreensis TaxID=266122 RepID=A0ABW2YM40_9GAMM
MLLWLALFFVIGAAGTWLARGYAVRRELLDHPGERRSHAVATPRGGGMAIVLALLVAASALAARHPLQVPLLVAFVLGLLLVAGVGLIDDHRPLSPWSRLVVHVLAAAVLAIGVAAAFGSLWVAAVAFIAALVLTNVWNFMDGINGLAASQAAIVAAGFAWLAGGVWGWLALALAAACLGFLPFNFPRARIFLGDVGSGALGYSLAALLAVVLGSQQRWWLPILLVPVSAFLVDAGLTLLRRLWRGERWWTAHTQHAYQVWARQAGSHAWPTAAYSAWTLCGVLAMGLLRSAPGSFILASSIAWYTSGAFLWWWLQRRELGRR